jgi:hypothetical protein
VVFGIGIGTQRNDDGGILKHVHGAMELDCRGGNGVEPARKDIGEGLVEGKGTAILKDQAAKFTVGDSRFKTQDVHRQVAHEMREGIEEELRCGRFVELFIEGVIIGVESPQLIEVPVQISDGLHVLGGHRSDHREAHAKRGDEAFALEQSEGVTAFIEDLFIQDRLELVGHGGNFLGIHATFLSSIEGVEGWMDLAKHLHDFKSLDDQNWGRILNSVRMCLYTTNRCERVKISHHIGATAFRFP